MSTLKSGKKLNILLPIDGSECSYDMLTWVKTMLSPENVNCYFLFVVTLMPMAYEVPYFNYDYEVEVAQKKLAEAKALYQAEGFTVKATDYVYGYPIEAICDYADRQEIDQIVMGSHGRQGLAKFLMGSVTEGVLKHAKQPVTVLNTGPHSVFAKQREMQGRALSKTA